MTRVPAQPKPYSPNQHPSDFWGENRIRALPFQRSAQCQTANPSNSLALQFLLLQLHEIVCWGFFLLSSELSTEEKLRRLQEERLCKICMDKTISVVLIPCGHLVACEDCARAVDRCPLCCTEIAKRQKIYTSWSQAPMLCKWETALPFRTLTTNVVLIQKRIFTKESFHLTLGSFIWIAKLLNSVHLIFLSLMPWPWETPTWGLDGLPLQVWLHCNSSYPVHLDVLDE